MLRILLLCALLALSCGQPPKPSPPASQAASQQAPAPPLKLTKPPLPPKQLVGIDLSQLDANELSQGGAYFIGRGQWEKAAQSLSWAVHRGADQRYNLACALSRDGQLEAAFYWLQNAALEEGVDAEWALGDADLENLRADPRWTKVGPFLQAMNADFRTRDMLKVNTVLPQGHDPKQPIVTVVGLHGLGGDQDFVDDGFQDLADELGVAFVGLSGTYPRGPKSFSWSEDRELDQQRVQRALESVKDKLTPKQGEILLFGFSQGGQMAFELAAAHPDLYRGALAMSPGKKDDRALTGLKASAGSKKQRFILLAGENEHPQTVEHARADAEWARKAGAQVKLKFYEGISEHAFPPDFVEQFPAWLGWLQGKKAEASGG